MTRIFLVASLLAVNLFGGQPQLPDSGRNASGQGNASTYLELTEKSTTSLSLRKPAQLEDMPHKTASEPVFQPLDISLSPELQLHAWKLCEQYNTPLPQQEFFDLVLRVMWHESRYIADVPDNINANGTRDRGLMQINSCVWSYLETEYGLDVSDPMQNIEAGVMFLANYLEKYSTNHALTAYAHGETGASRLGGSSAFSVRILTLPSDNYLERA